MKNLLSGILVLSSIIACGEAKDRGSRTTATDAAGWSHVTLVGADATHISIDYQQGSDSGGYLAKPVWINVDLPASADCATSGQAVLLDRFDSVGGAHEFAVDKIDLTSSGEPCRLTGSLGSPYGGTGSLYIGFFGGGAYRQELAVVIDNRWLVDPISGSNNFKFSMLTHD